VERPTSKLMDDLAAIDIPQGLLFGAAMGLGLSVLAVLLVALHLLWQVLRPPHEIVTAGLALQLAEISLTYLGAFTLAGGVLGAINHVPLGVLRVPLTAFVLGASIYAGVGIGMHFFDPDRPSVAFVLGFSVLMGVAWMVIAMVNERRSRQRRRTQGARRYGAPTSSRRTVVGFRASVDRVRHGRSPASGSRPDPRHARRRVARTTCRPDRLLWGLEDGRGYGPPGAGRVVATPRCMRFATASGASSWPAARCSTASST
jgi:hypothetical protein